MIEKNEEIHVDKIFDGDEKFGWTFWKRFQTLIGGFGSKEGECALCFLFLLLFFRGT
jgi:hypothetical protein